MYLDVVRHTSFTRLDWISCKESMVISMYVDSQSAISAISYNHVHLKVVHGKLHNISLENSIRIRYRDMMKILGNEGPTTKRTFF